METLRNMIFPSSHDPRVSSKGAFARPWGLLLLMPVIVLSGVPELRDEIGSLVAMRKASQEIQEGALYGTHAALLRTVQTQLPVDAKILLLTQADPALLAYYFYPRRVFTPSANPPSVHRMMVVPPNSFPDKDVASFDVDFVLRLEPTSWDLRPTQETLADEPLNR